MTLDKQIRLLSCILGGAILGAALVQCVSISTIACVIGALGGAAFGAAIVLVGSESEKELNMNAHDVPRVGVALIIRKGNQVLLHKRLGHHAPDTWSFAGGHLEKFETWEEAALREMEEEVGSDIKVTHPVYWTASNTRFYDEDKHYIVIFMIADWIEGEAYVTEPDKCACWEWHDWDNLPQPLMMGCQDLVNRGLSPFDV